VTDRTHAAGRGRIGRLLERWRTARGCSASMRTIVVEGTDFRVIGSGAVYVVDGAGAAPSERPADMCRGVAAPKPVARYVR
jgi:cyanophycinase-like exopeptidase